MKLLGVGTVLVLALFPVGGFSQVTAIGSWKVVKYVGPQSDQLMMGTLSFTVEATGAGLTGTAVAEGWPGELEVTDLRLDGNRLRFTGTGKVGSSSRLGDAPPVDVCCPKLSFDGIIDGDRMQLTVIWGNTGSSRQSRPQLFQATKTR